MIDLPRVGAHYAISILFEDYGERTRIFAYTVERQAHQILTSKEATLTVGRPRVTSQITREAVTVDYGAAHFGNQYLTACVRTCRASSSTPWNKPWNGWPSEWVSNPAGRNSPVR